MSQSNSRFRSIFGRKPKPAPESPGTRQVPWELPAVDLGSPNTTFMRLEELTASAPVPKTSNELLTRLKEQISQLKVIEHGSVLNTSRDASGSEVYHPLPERIVGASMIKTDAGTFLVGRTRSTWLVLYGTPHETLHDRDPQMMDVDFKKRDKAVTRSGKMMYLSSVTTQDINILNSIAARDARKRQNARAPDTLVPAEGVFSSDETRARLEKCQLGYCTDVYFDLFGFIKTIQFMTPTQGGAGDYYYLLAGDRECELHVNTDPGHPEGSYAHKATLYYGMEPCFLYMGVHY